jgi:hypothetical protein
MILDLDRLFHGRRNKSSLRVTGRNERKKFSRSFDLFSITKLINFQKKKKSITL